MGASQSTSQGSSVTDSATTKTCYYELIGVERDASESDIKKAYRRRALELHPDRNFGDTDAATQKFAELQSAYEILSDPHERAWYDSHREAILSGQEVTGDGNETASFRNIRITSTEEIMSLMRKFNATVPFNDDPIGFFTIARETFERLALEEEAAAELGNVNPIDYPNFGQASDDYEEVVKPFYASWAGFASKKTFTWKDKYRLSDAPDRRVRRLMEKENKKLREDAAREFNDAVRFLVTFVRKRDPRYIPNTQTEAERQETSRVAAAAQAARSRAANQERMANYKLPDWATPQDTTDEAEFSVSDAESEVEILECVVCDKTFKSEKQLEAHERSKKHVKAVQHLQWQMRREGVELQLNEHPSEPVQYEGAAVRQGTVDASEASHRSTPPLRPANSTVSASASVKSAGESEEDGDYAPRSAVMDRIKDNRLDESQIFTEMSETGMQGLSNATSSITLADEGGQRKIGKARAKRERKAAAAQTSAELKHQCTVCAEEFDSRTKLFAHIRVEDHAVAPHPGNVKGGKKRR